MLHLGMLYRIREGTYDLPIARLGQPDSGIYQATLMTLDGEMNRVELITMEMIGSERPEEKVIALRNPEEYRPNIDDMRRKFLPQRV